MAAAQFSDLSFGDLLLGIIVSAALSMWVYWHASKHGSKRATAWGVVVFLLSPAVLVYLLHFFANRRRL